MESNKIDQLFRNNLDRHQVKPGEDAWSKLSSQLPTQKNSNKKAFYWSIAASICLLIVCSIFIKNGSFNEQINNQKGYAVQFDQSTNAFASNELATLPQPKAPEKNYTTKDFSAKNPHQETENKAFKSEVANQVAQNNDRIVLKKIDPTTDNLKTNKLFDSNTHMLNIQTQLIVVNSYHDNVENAKEKFNEKESNTILKTKDKIKSLASELSIADLRSAKNELFASALQIEKKHTN